MSTAIGIKLADGSFYPILEEGLPEKKILELTTVNDNQTTVQVDLYRTDNGTMENAEYIDTLRIDNLLPHPNGEPNINLSIGLDENGELSAEVLDPETGSRTNTSVNLVTRTVEEREKAPDFNLTETFDVPELDGFDSTTDVSDIDVPDLDVLDIDQSDSNDIADSDNPVQRIAESENDSSLNEKIRNDESSINADEISSDSGIVDPDADIVMSEFDLPEIEPVETDEVLQDNPFLSVDVQPSVAVQPDHDAATEKLSSKEIDQIELNETKDNVFDITDEMSSAETGEVEASSAEDNNDTDTLFDLPDIDFTPTEISSDLNIDEVADLPDFNISDQKTFSLSDEETEKLPDFSDMDFDIPDFEESNEKPLNLSNLLDDDAFNIPDSEINSSESFDDTDFSVPISEQEQNSFKRDTAIPDTPLFDETLFDDTENTKNGKSQIGAVVICIICAVICLAALAGIFMLVPSRLNLGFLKNRDGNSSEPVQVQSSVLREDAVMPKENQIVIAPSPDIIPLPPAPVPVSEEGVTYQIKWGDTLWDLAAAYYKNPWRYPEIAAANNISNPDYIISGTYITIPPK